MNDRRTEHENPPFHPESKEVIDYRMENNRVEDFTVPPTMGKLPNPGSESVGPSLFDLVQRTQRAIEVQSELLRRAVPLMDERIIVEGSSGQTDGSGNLDLAIYRVPQGMQLCITRVNFDDGISTPATPFTFATGWVALIVAEKYQPGTIVDFLPNPPVASGPIFPGQFSDGNSEAAVIRAGQLITLHVFNGPVNRDIWVRLQGYEKPV